MTSWLKWTAEELAALKILCEKGWSSQEIVDAGVFGVRTKHAIENCAHTRGWRMGAMVKRSGFDPKKFQALLKEKII